MPLLALLFVAMAASFVVFAVMLKVLVRLILLPLFLLKWIISGVVFLVVGPVLFVVGLIACVALSLVLAIPLLPLAVVGALVYLLVRQSRRPVVFRA